MEHQGAHEVGGVPRGAHPRGKGVGPLIFIFGEDFLLFFLRCSVEFQDIPRIFIFCTKNNTMAVLLKTASVRVSSIQIMQVRVQNKGKSVWKSRYIGDVSTPPSLNLCLSSCNPVDKLKVIKKLLQTLFALVVVNMKSQHSSFSKYYELTILTITLRSHNYSYQ